MFETSCGLGIKLYTEKLVLRTYRGHDGVAMAGGGVELQTIHRFYHNHEILKREGALN